jgi:UrcA family protein
MKPILCAIALLAALPAQALAQQPGPDSRAPQVRVQYDDLNLRTSAGVERFDRRLARAVRAVCPDARGTIDVVRKVAARNCVAATTDEVAQLRNRILAAEGDPAILAARAR